ncbi:DUF4843 domain-containing protein [uncultured Chitinophaga sp.]|uniref:DUF4843 domain-containing protein n=1 Tax=uncultured Chitinophaga sp. TaxID=339340 RepID=UPI0025CC65F3|nr:DUF4843 domain-containing protein [uncultured Chitinophaga sp.]
MKNIVTGILAACFSSLLLISCEREKLDLYNQDKEGSSIYFKEKFDNLLDQYAPLFINKYITLGYTPLAVTDTIINIPVAFTGNVSDSDRVYKVVIDTSSTMIEGTDFVFVKPFVMKANRVADSIQVKLLRNQRMRDTTLALNLTLEANEYFNINVPVKKNYAGNATRSIINYQVEANDITGKPFLWTSTTYKTYSEGYFGTYSKAKFLLMIDVLDIKIEVVTVEPVLPARFSLDYFLIWSNYMVYWLGKEKAEGRIYYDEFGAEIKMGPNAR